jgi:hypothetical protein
MEKKENKPLTPQTRRFTVGFIFKLAWSGGSLMVALGSLWGVVML